VSQYDQELEDAKMQQSEESSRDGADVEPQIDANDLELQEGELGDPGDFGDDDAEMIGDSVLAGDLAIETPKTRLLSAMRLEAKIEAIIFAAQKPLKIAEIHEILADVNISETDIETTLEQLVEFYEDRGGGFKLHYLKRLGYQFQTVQDAGVIMERMFATRPRPISRAALETLTIIAYRQPATRAEVEFIRGVDAGSIFKTLLERGLIRCVGRKEVVGRPMLFGTTDDFLKVFNLSSIKDLPPLEAFQPAREVMQGAISKIDDEEGPVDIEQYIADNTAELDGASLADDADFGAEDGSESDQNSETTFTGATQAKGSFEEDDDGTNTTTEMDSPTGLGLPPRSGDLDL
jgi:segregation and condensation protein B